MRGKSFFGIIALFFLGVATANAYAVSSTGQPLGGYQPTSTSVDTNYNFNGSFQNLVSPFQDFFDSLKWTGSTSIQIYPTSTSIVLPPITIPTGVQNIFTQFDNWFYNLTGIRLSGVSAAVLTGLSWLINGAQGIANWIAGLFH